MIAIFAINLCEMMGMMKQWMILCAVLLPLSLAAATEADHTPLQKKYAESGVAAAFVAGADWFPLPAYTDREAWAGLFGDAAAKVIRGGEKALGYSWQHIPASAYLAYEREGNRAPMESIDKKNRRNLMALLLAELAEGKGRFLPQLADGVWFAAEQTSWVLSAHLPCQRSRRSLPDAREQLIDLGSARTGALVALVWHFFAAEFDRIDPSISAAVERAVKRNILDPYLDEAEREANWWMGKTKKKRHLSNWTPWCVSDVSLAFLLMERDQMRLDAAMRLSTEAVDAWLGGISPDGACEEGPTYWGQAAGKLLDLLQIWKDASGGRFDLMDDARFRRMGDYISRAYIGDGWMVNFADADARQPGAPSLIWRYGRATGSRELMDFGLYLSADVQKGRFSTPGLVMGDGYRALAGVRCRPAMARQVDSLNRKVAQSSFAEVCSGLRESVPATTWYPETQVCMLRGAGDWFLAAKGGFNDECHNHNDVGSCILFAGNRPVLVDAGVGTYTRTTFSKDRYTLWTMQAGWHNLPLPGGVEQPHGSKYKASELRCDEKNGLFSLELSAAYPDTAGILSLRRTYRLSMKGRPSLNVTDAYALKARRAADRTCFLVQGEVLLPGEPYGGRPVAAGTLLILVEDGPVIRMRYPAQLTPSVEVKELEDKKLSSPWGPCLRRIVLRSAPDAPLKGAYSYRFEPVDDIRGRN